jgi:ATP-binding protein involved in chromosome partitioning
VKDYFDIEGDGGSGIIGQVVALQDKVAEKLSRVRHRLAIASGKGGVGKSTLAMQLAAALRQQGKQVTLLDGDVNGPSLARMAALQDSLLIPGPNGLHVPKTKDGIGVMSLGSMVPESEAIDFDSVAPTDSFTWRATKEFSTLRDLLAATDWGTLDYLMVDLPPGAQKCAEFSEFLGPKTTFVLVTIPSDVSHGVVRRSVAALKKLKQPLLGYVENMSGYYCDECKKIKPLFPQPELSQFESPRLASIPFDPKLAALCDRGQPLAYLYDSPAAQAILALAKSIDKMMEAQS